MNGLKHQKESEGVVPLAVKAQGKPTRGLAGMQGYRSKLRDELLNGEIFYSLKEAQVVIGQWRKHYNTIRPHSSLGYRPPAPQTMNPFLSPLDRPPPDATISR